MTSDCPFCQLTNQRIILENEHGLFLQEMIPSSVLIGSGVIVPRQHRATVFDLTAEEWAATQTLLMQARAYLDAHYAPQGYNIGWNSGEVAGQVIFHAHLHIMTRYADEPYAGKGIRHWLKQEANRRPD